MKLNIRDLLLPFYFGSVNEEERLFIEREMLSDTEVLVDYLDLKRQVEAATPLATQPSPHLWERLRPKTPAQRRAWLSLSIGAALATGLAFFFLLHSTTQITEINQPSINRAIFDSSSELPASSSVL
jgi:hypothetical protein